MKNNAMAMKGRLKQVRIILFYLHAVHLKVFLLRILLVQWKFCFRLTLKAKISRKKSTI